MTPLRFLRSVVGVGLLFAAFVAQLIADVFADAAAGVYGWAERVLS